MDLKLIKQREEQNEISTYGLVWKEQSGRLLKFLFIKPRNIAEITTFIRKNKRKAATLPRGKNDGKGSYLPYVWDGIPGNVYRNLNYFPKGWVTHLEDKQKPKSTEIESYLDKLKLKMDDKEFEELEKTELYKSFVYDLRTYFSYPKIRRELVAINNTKTYPYLPDLIENEVLDCFSDGSKYFSEEEIPYIGDNDAKQRNLKIINCPSLHKKDILVLIKEIGVEESDENIVTFVRFVFASRLERKYRTILNPPSPFSLKVEEKKEKLKQEGFSDMTAHVLALSDKHNEDEYSNNLKTKEGRAKLLNSGRLNTFRRAGCLPKTTFRTFVLKK